MKDVEFSISTSIRVSSLSTATKALILVGEGWPSVYCPSNSTTSHADMNTWISIKMVKLILKPSPIRELEGRKAMLLPPSDYN